MGPAFQKARLNGSKKEEEEEEEETQMMGILISYIKL
jgi:hypothetical protein